MEIRGSLKIYLTLLGLSNAREIARMSIIGLLCVRSWWNGTPEFMVFFAGVLFAELSTSGSFKQQEIRAHISPSYRGHREPSSYKTTLDRLSTLSRYLVFVVGIYLLCLPIRFQPDGTVDANFPPDWFFLKLSLPLPWWDTETTMRTWHTFGAILVIGSMRVSPRLRAPFETRAAQFLGHISFSLYLCHQTILRIMLHWSLHWISLCVTGVSYFDAHPQGKWGIVFIAWILTIPLVVGVLLLISVHMAEAVDQKSIAMGFCIERRLCGL